MPWSTTASSTAGSRSCTNPSPLTPSDSKSATYSTEQSIRPFRDAARIHSFAQVASRRLRDEGQEAARVVDQNGMKHFVLHAGLLQLRHEHRCHPTVRRQIDRPGAGVIRG